VRFCESELRLRGGQVKADPLPNDPVLLSDQPVSPPDPRREWLRTALRDLREEFSREWPRETALQDRVRQAWDWGRNDPSVWLITTLPEGRPAVDEGREVCGLVVAWPGATGANDVELLVYVRGPYRDLGVGRAAMKFVLEQMKTAARYQQASLLTRYPREGVECGDKRLGNAIWWTFFTFYGFRTLDQATEGERRYLVLSARPEKWQDLA
jgi:GNAT superfamily N-acetyltransferase